MRRLAIMVAVIAITVVGVGLIVVPRYFRARPAAPGGQPSATTAPTPERKITATFFYVAEDGLSLAAVQREVSFGEPVSEQARHIVEMQIAPPPAPHVSAIPQGTKLRAVYVSEQGEAFVDVTGEVSRNHTGGALDELFAVYTIVNAVTVNLPAIKRVQILVDGKEVDTLAGHVDLRQPFAKNTQWIAEKQE